MPASVAIVGAGPVGLLLANLLGRRGVPLRVLEKQPQPYPLPRAIHFDGEAMRCFQAAGLAEAILPHTHVGKGMLFQDGAGRTLVDWSRDQQIGLMGWYESYRFYQPGLEAVLREGLKRFDWVTLEPGREVVGLAQSGAGVTLSLADGDAVEAGFAIGCDGAQSVLRDALGIGMTDLGFHERWLVVDLRLTRPRDDLGDYSIQFCDPEAPATYVRGVGDRRRWEMRLEDGAPDRPDAAEVWRRLARWITPQDADLERSAVYTFRSRIASAWRRGRCLLAGDAAHQMPPFMGQGMCAGVRDAANLWWKLTAVLNGAPDDLLDSYQSEREANVRAFIEKSVALGRLINQTAAGAVPQGRMASIWPDLGPGLGPRDGVGGGLVPQVRLASGALADDTAEHGFYVLARAGTAVDGWHCVDGADGWLADRDLDGVVVRPDGYCLAGFRSSTDLTKIADQFAALGLSAAPGSASDTA
ncbi:MAG: bifunctional 3-(3-hydroxy-phenyl)propionate/3-hydroxycinnamic acid hydroxylase [Rhodobacter sp.]|nr:bifunctional 3-(3-hydroxy-phenyl)propionate/3-hydroxycinnamic acid hydroxylase [Rhodobacter sp.]